MFSSVFKNKRLNREPLKKTAGSRWADLSYIAQVLTLPVALISAATSGYFSYRAIEIASAALAMESKYKAASMRPRLFGKTEFSEGKISIMNTGSGPAEIVSVAIEFRGKCTISSDRLNWAGEFDAIMRSVSDSYAAQLRSLSLVEQSYRPLANVNSDGSQKDLVPSGEWVLMKMSPVEAKADDQYKAATEAWAQIVGDLNFSLIYKPLVEGENIEFASSDQPLSKLWSCLSARRR
ncbi:hypothetical protein [Bosea sp. RAC05]|uniref:hypothetical protein n=1 Tax=Bosea sp. RAC05 TaxID=1842539 RepID=UPI00083CF627|nr:hypothetical protein [Bosea sp. RAC05]AOG03314.1 hypothetical protein BSY19_4770 [Bosea sp. RAC05]